MSSRPVTVATSWAAFGFGWHGGGGCSAKAVRWVMVTRVSIANSETHRVRFAGLVPIFSPLSVGLIRFMFFSFPFNDRNFLLRKKCDRFPLMRQNRSEKSG